MILNAPALLVAILPALVSEGSAQLTGDHPWGKFKVGTSVTWKTVTVLKTGASPSEYLSETKQTLVSLTSEKAVVEFVQSSAGTPAQKPTLVDLPFKPEPVDPKLAAQAPKPSKTGTETLSVAGRTFACTWSETVMGDKGSGHTVMRTWESADMPGRIVKSVSTSEMAPGMTSVMTTEVASFVIK